MPVSSTDQPERDRSERVVVVGGGLAGIAAALRLAERGLAVTLVETRKRLGGRATSFADPANGRLLDNCQHVLLGCCTNLIDLYHRLGVEDRIEWHRRLYFTDARGALDALEADGLPAPLHMTRALLRFKTLAWGEKVAIARGMAAIMRMGKAGRDRLHDRTFADWLRAQDQPAGAIRKFWAVVTVSAINELPERMAADYAIHVFQDAFLASKAGYTMGLAAVPLVELYDAAERVLAAAGGELMLSTSAERFVYEGGRVVGLEIDGGRRLEADAFVSAVPFDRLAKLATPEMTAADERLRHLGEFGVSPIIGVHLWFRTASGRPVMTLPHLVLMESPVQWLFNKGSDPCAGGQHLHAVISAAHDLVDEPADQISQMVAAEARKALGGEAATAELLHARVIKEKRATFSARPGLEAIRPGPRGAIANLYLAGDWCKSGWPATMEGAARSGYLAAQAVLDDRGGGGEPLVPELEPAWLYRVASRGR